MTPIQVTETPKTAEPTEAPATMTMTQSPTIVIPTFAPSMTTAAATTPTNSPVIVEESQSPASDSLTIASNNFPPEQSSSMDSLAEARFPPEGSSSFSRDSSTIAEEDHSSSSSSMDSLVHANLPIEESSSLDSSSSLPVSATGRFWGGASAMVLPRTSKAPTSEPSDSPSSALTTMSLKPLAVVEESALPVVNSPAFATITNTNENGPLRVKEEHPMMIDDMVAQRTVPLRVPGYTAVGPGMRRRTLIKANRHSSKGLTRSERPYGLRNSNENTRHQKRRPETRTFFRGVRRMSVER